MLKVKTTNTAIVSGQQAKPGNEFIYSPGVGRALARPILVNFPDNQAWGYQPDPSDRAQHITMMGKDLRTAMETSGYDPDAIIKKNVFTWRK